MARRFIHAKPGPSNLIAYLLVVVALLVWVEHGGREAWAGFVAGRGDLELIVGWGFGLYLGWFWLLGLGYLSLDAIRDRASGQAPDQRSWLGRKLLAWEIQQPESHAARRADVGRAKTVAVVVRNQLLGTWPVLGLLYLLLGARGVSVHDPIPGVVESLASLVAIALLLEVAFYTVHRALHEPRLFRRIHRIHHEYRKPSAIATHYVHIVEHLLGSLLPVFIGPVVLAVHPFVIALWSGIAVFNALHTHSGYAIPGLVYAHDHDFHHYRLRGNYGSLGLLDALLGTNAEFVRARLH